MTIKFRPYYSLVTLLFLILGCVNYGNKWNDDFVNGKIDKDNILLELPLGSKYDQLILYIKKHNIPKYAKNKLFGYSEKDYSKGFTPDLNINLVDKLEYFVTIDGHKKYDDFPYYYHPILYFYFDKNDTFFNIGMHGYP
jgi:hypothetical protein